MGKKTGLVVFLIIIAALFASCNRNKNDNQSVQPLYPTIQLRRATGENIDRYNDAYKYNDANNYNDRIMLYADIALKDFEFLAVNYDYDRESYIAERVLFSAGELPAMNPFFASYTFIEDGIPVRGISFTDINNVKRYYYIVESGNENFPSLVEFVITSSQAASDSQGIYPKILNGDLSDFAGTWINNGGNERALKADGTSGGGQKSYGFGFNENYYEWGVGFEEYGGYTVYLLPPGVDIKGYIEITDGVVYDILPTNNTKERIVIITGDSPFISAVFYREAEIKSIPYTFEFNNNRIPVTVFYTIYDDGNYKIDRAVINYGGMNHTLLLDRMYVWHEALSVLVDDYNFDGYADVNIINAFGANSENNIFIYNQYTKSFYFNNVLSSGGSIIIDNETHSLLKIFHDYDYNITRYSEYKWEGDELIYIEINSDDAERRISAAKERNKTNTQEGR